MVTKIPMHATERFDAKTLDEARRALAADLKSAGISSAELDARLLVGAAVGLDLTGMVRAGNRRLAARECDQLAEFKERRLAGEPVARLLRAREFWGLPLQLSPETLIPRPDSETVVELALEMERHERRLGSPLRLVDIGTGSGAILLALLSELPGATGVGTDISAAALRTASGNAERLGLTSRAAFVACNYTAALSGVFDLIVSNPPYIRSSEIASLSPEVRQHDPLVALDGGPDGLDAYRSLIPLAVRLLAPGGALVVEIGYGQGVAVLELMATAGLTPAGPPKSDLAGIPRALAGRNLPR